MALHYYGHCESLQTKRLRVLKKPETNQTSINSSDYIINKQCNPAGFFPHYVTSVYKCFAFKSPGVPPITADV